MPRTRPVERDEMLPLRNDGRLRLAAVADTHSSPHRNLYAQLRALKPDAILHGGDIGDLGVLDALAQIAPVFAVRGNIDVRAPSLPDLLTLAVGPKAAPVIRILLTHIALNGTKLRGEVAARARSVQAALVVCGHSHVPFVGVERRLVVFNPGSAGPRRFRLPILFGVIEIAPTGIEVAHIDCETGQPWTPPQV